MGGRYLYLRDNASGEFWSPTWMPTRKPLDEYSCRHGMGYTRISSTCQDVRAEVCYFVPPGAPLEIWDVRVQNLAKEEKSLSLFSSVEFALWNALDDSTNFQRNLNIGELEVKDSVIYHKTEYRERRNHFAFFACSEPLAGFETQREAFLGAYCGWESPCDVVMDETNDSLHVGGAPVGVHHLRLNLAPGEEKRVIFLLGYHENPVDKKFSPPRSQKINKRTVLPIIKHYLKPAVVDSAFEQLRAIWDDLLSVVHTETPNPHVDRMVNIWNAYQCMVTFNLSRSASYFESGIGRGMGFRDSNQDLLGFVQMIPDRARQRILDLAATQLETGGAYHQYQPLTKRGNDAVGGNFNDDPAWLVLSTAAYLKETADWSILDEQVPFDNKPGTEVGLLEHLKRSLQYTLDNLGPHGLPLIGRADWNDCLNLNTFSSKPGESFQTATAQDGKVAESVVIAALFTLAVRELAQIMAHMEQPEEAKKLEDLAAEMTAKTRRYGWDGAWFLRAYNHFGKEVGSKVCKEGRIFIEPQGLCTMAGIGVEDGLAATALKSVGKYLATQHGVVLLQPAYTHYQIELGEISSYPPGNKENASIFCHTNPWIMIAEAILGHGEQALDYYLRINPSAREAISEVHQCEPYCYAQTIAGKDADNFGAARNSWLTGTAAWNMVAVTQWILGIRPEYDGLRIDPCIPPSWDGFQIRRKFRGATYEIRVINPDHGSKGVASLTLDGMAQTGNLIPCHSDGETHHIEVRLG
jgi:cellobiose phosphorylase